MEPCETLLKMSPKLLQEPVTFVLYFLFSKEDAKKYSEFVSTLYAFSFAINN